MQKKVILLDSSNMPYMIIKITTNYTGKPTYVWFGLWAVEYRMRSSFNECLMIKLRDNLCDTNNLKGDTI